MTVFRIASLGTSLSAWLSTLTADSSCASGSANKHVRLFRLLSYSALLVIAACQDLSVTNPNEPDRERALGNAQDVQALIASSFTPWWRVAQGSLPGFPFTAMADEFTSGFADYGILDASSEPRIAFNNSTANSRRFQNETPWYELYATLSNINDAMAAIDRGVRITEGGEDVTQRARAFGRLMQGLTLGYVALIFDQGYVVDERTSEEEIGRPQLRSYTEIRDTALAYIDDAIAIAGRNTFTVPSSGWINGITLDNVAFAKLARSMQARLLVYTARTPAERAAVDWSRVSALVDNGLTTDFAPIGIPDVLYSDMRRVVARERPNRPPGDFARVDYFLVGVADTSGQFQQWVASPLSAREPFRIATPDRRVQGDDGPESAGSYVAYDANTIFALDRGVYQRSFYWYHRLGRGTSYQNGPQLAVTVAELRLLRAEALIRQGSLTAAALIINETRTANGGLAPVTEAGPVDNDSCVPRKVNSDACGSLWDALRWEKRIEGLGVDPNVAFFDARGWGTLIAGTPVHMPVPARELETLALPLYTFGGSGAGSATAPDYDGCPVAMQRCTP